MSACEDARARRMHRSVEVGERPWGIAISHDDRTLFTANGGTNDVGVISWQKALARDPKAEIARIPTQMGGFGISTSPDGKLVAVASREDLALDKPDNTISIIDVEKALTNPARCCYSPSSVEPRCSGGQ